MNLFKKINLLSLCAAVLFFIASIAMAEESAAGLYLEPAGTYELGDTKVNYPTPLFSSTGRAVGFGLGMRVGFHLQKMLFMALDGRYSMPQFKDDSIAYDAKAKSMNWGVVIGGQVPVIGLRLWAAYILDGYLNPERDGNFDFSFSKATGYRVGIGFMPAFFSINMEYQSLKYAETEIERLSTFTPGTKLGSINLENKSWVGSISIPISL